jgi:glycosyltransferase involved in cell wall biosynthesis
MVHPHPRARCKRTLTPGTGDGARRVVRDVHALPPMKVSVVIPTYNRAHSVVDAIASVLEQRYRELEIIVVDDGSTDDTAARIAGIADPRLRYVRGRHEGVSAARNLGVRHASGELVAFLDSDDLWRPDKLTREMEALVRHPDVDVVFSDLEKRHGDRVYPSFMRETAVFSRRLREASYPEGLVLEAREMRLCLLEEVPVKPSALLLRRAAFDRTGGFDETWTSSEDWEFLLRLARDHRFVYLDRPLSVLFISPDSLHITDQSRGEEAMIELLGREARRLAGDGEARAAVHRGLVTRIKHYAWHHIDHGRRARACGIYLRGFARTGDLGLLLRAAASWIPRALHPSPTERREHTLLARF